jgi:hypothetical protein
MSVVDGQQVNAAVTNAAFVSKTATTGNTAIGIINLNNTSDVNSGSAINNIQRGINETFDAVGMTGVADATRNDYSSNNIVTNGDDRKVAIGKIDAEFAGTGGHSHTGVNGEGTKILASDLDDFNNFFADWQEFTKDTVSGTSVVVTTELSGKTAGGATAAAGVITSAPNNRVIIQDKETEDNIEDAEGQKVYGRITESGGTWTLSFYTNEAGVETAHSLSSQNIRVFFREVFTAETRPTIPSSLANMPSMDFTADIIDASSTQRGVVNLLTQSFTGIKHFVNKITVVLQKLSISNDITSSYWGDTVFAFFGVTDLINDANKAVAYGSTDTAQDIGTNQVLSQTGAITAVNATANTGDRFDITGAITNSGSSGNTGNSFRHSGDNAGTGDTGTISSYSGNAAQGSSGPNVNFTGTASGVGKTSGDVTFYTGDGSSGANSGDVVFTTGSVTGGGTRGKIRKVDGSEGTIGHVWTSVGVDGSGAWAAPSGGGGAGGLKWYFGNGLTPEIQIKSSGLETYAFAQTDDQEIFVKIKIPTGFVNGTQCFLRNGHFFTSVTSGNVLFRATSYIFRSNVNGNGTPGSYSSTNSEQAVNGTSNQITVLTALDITDGSGQINGVTVTAGDTLLVRLQRLASSETSGAAADVNLIPESLEADIS